MFAEWTRPFFKAGPRTDIRLSAGNPTVISMDEELSVLEPIIVAIVLGYFQFNIWCFLTKKVHCIFQLHRGCKTRNRKFSKRKQFRSGT